jgi:Fur family transcriptional regulator, peroxide stress response regulator
MNRKSRQREAIGRALRGTSSHPSAEWIYERVRKEMPGVGLATVYRNLRLMKAAGEICELDTADSESHFDGDTSLHYHFLCDRCGRIVDLDEPVDADVESRVEQRTGLKVTRHHLALYGLCVECQEHQPGTDLGTPQR